MIIACPECTGPFELADGNIAPLVQIECPTCKFRMILDFAAANDTSLREDGMGLAHGFRDETSYRQAVGAGQVSYAAPSGTPAAKQPSLRAVPAEPEPVVAQPAPEPRVAPRPQPRPEPAPEPVAERPPVRQPPSEPAAERPPVRQPAPQPEPSLDKPPVRHPPEEPVVARPSQPRSRPTLIAHTPPAPRPPAPEPIRPEPPAPVHAHAHAEAQVETHVGPSPLATGSVPTLPAEPTTEDIELDDFDEPETQVHVREPRTPPHTPVREPAPELAPDASGPARPEPAADTSKPSTRPEAKPEAKPAADAGKRSPVVSALMFVLLLLLLGAGGLMVWSLVTTGDPFQKVLELTGQAPPAAPAPAPAPADGKAGAPKQ